MGGSKFNVINGYKGTSVIRVAMRSKELDGGCWGWEAKRASLKWSMCRRMKTKRALQFLVKKQKTVSRDKQDNSDKQREEDL
jgi:hypothetical protein